LLTSAAEETKYVIHLIKMSGMSENNTVVKTAKHDQKSYFGHFQILLEMCTEICT